MYLSLVASVAVAGWFLPVVFLRAVAAGTGFALAPLIKQPVGLRRFTFSPRILAMGSLGVVAFLSFNTGVSVAPDSLPIMTALAGTASAFVVLYAKVFIHEELELNQLAGIIILIVAVFALLYFGR